MRWDLIDSFQSIKKGQSARGIKAFKGSEDFFADHFPGNPLVPEPFYIEMVAQVGGVLYGFGFDFSKEVILAKVLSAEFFKPVAPPCSFDIEASLESDSDQGGWICGTVSYLGEKVAEVHLLLVSIDELPLATGDQKKSKSIVFSETFLKHCDIYEVAKKSLKND